MHFKNFREHIHGEPFHTTILKGIEGPKLPQTFAGDHILLLSWHLIRTEDLIFSTEVTRRTEDLAVGTISVRYLMIFGFGGIGITLFFLKKTLLYDCVL